jgi:hypothetical protein
LNDVSGDLRRYSNVQSILPANLTLPALYGIGSLSFCCNINIDSTAPYVESLIPLKRAGVYGENELIIIVVRFNKPVVVQGNVTLTLKTGKDISIPPYR